MPAARVANQCVLSVLYCLPFVYIQAVMKQVDLLSQHTHTPSSPSTSPAGLPQQLSGAAPVGSVGQLSALLARGFRSYWSNPSTNLSRFLVTLAMGLIVGSIEWGKGK